MTLRSAPRPTPHSQRLVHGLTALAAVAVAVGLWIARPQPPDLPPVYVQADLEVTGLT